MNDDLNEIAKWLKVNKLSLNIKKTHYMIFSGKNKPHPNITIKIDGKLLDETKKTKFLGVIIDKDLSWKNHISYVCGKIARGIGVIVKARRYLLKESLINLYYSFVYPYLIYCNHIWGSTCATYLNSLVVLQKRVIRIIAGIKPRSHTGNVFTELKLLKCVDINTYLIGRLMYRVYNGDYSLFQPMFVKNKDIHDHNTRQIDHYHMPKFKSRLGKSSLRYSGALIWNNILKLGIADVNSEYTFAKHLKLAIMNGKL